MIGKTIGPYRVVRKLGAGGMGAVFEAVHESIERRVSIKVLHPEYARNAEFAQRFFNEARAVNRADHPGLVQVSDYGQLPDGTAYIVMELVKGETLGRRMQYLGGAMAVEEVLRLGLQIADSLAAAHAKHIVHRDIKPENVMIIPDPQMPGGERTKLLDFGIAEVRAAVIDGVSASLLPGGKEAERLPGPGRKPRARFRITQARSPGPDYPGSALRTALSRSTKVDLS